VDAVVLFHLATLGGDQHFADGEGEEPKVRIW
jgi:hypothetical protein